jgi:hypothetical protein
MSVAMPRRKLTLMEASWLRTKSDFSEPSSSVSLAELLPKSMPRTTDPWCFSRSHSS